jgi:hypothetical protein
MEQEAHFMNNYLVLKQDSLPFHSNCLYCIVVLQTHCRVILLSYRHIDQAGECKFNIIIHNKRKPRETRNVVESIVAAK